MGSTRPEVLRHEMLTLRTLHTRIMRDSVGAAAEAVTVDDSEEASVLSMA